MSPCTLQELAHLLGGEIAGRQVRCPGPGHSHRDRSLSVKPSTTAPDGFTTYSHASDDWRDCRDHVRRKLGLPDWEPGDGRERNRAVDPCHWDFSALEAQVEGAPLSDEDRKRIHDARVLWHNAQEPRGTAAEKYLAARALKIHDDLAGTVLRFHPRTPWRDENTGTIERVECLIAAFTSIDTNEITAVHRIRVDQPQHWPKTQRRMLGMVHRAAIKLAKAANELLIAEGLETAMSPREAGFATPCWAMGSVGGISALPVLDGVNKLMLAAELDKADLRQLNKASARAIELCRRRWQLAGRKTTMLRPTAGDDLNAALMAKVTGAAA